MPIGTKKFETNSDHPYRRRWRVFPRTAKKGLYGVKPDKDGPELKFNSQGYVDTDDAGIAHAIHDSTGQGGDGDILVCPIETHPNPKHTRTFIVPDLPWHKDK